MNKDSQRCYDIIKQYYTEIYGFSLKNKTLDSINYKNKSHILLALICHLSLNEEFIQKRTILKKLNNSFITREVDFNSECIKPLYKTLLYKRLFKVSPLVGLFKLKRYSIDKLNHKDILRLYWDYFAYNTPLWKERVKKCNGKCDHKSFRLTFEK